MNMRASNAKEPLVNSRRRVGERLRELREQRHWTQVDLADRLFLSQARLSHIERGEASLTAEQLLEVLKIFNVSITDFDAQPSPDPQQALQNVLARLGARHLRTSEQALPSEHLAEVQNAVLETLVLGSPRLLTSLAPVLVNNAEVLYFPKLSMELDSLGLRRRLYWAIENTIEALRLEPKPPNRLEYLREQLAQRRLETVLAFSRGYEQLIQDSPDLLEPSLRSKKSSDKILEAASSISKRWQIVTSLQPSDFAAALRASRAGG
jgi:transcriptional regulator with XRE-family HTH domain